MKEHHHDLQEDLENNDQEPNEPNEPKPNELDSTVSIFAGISCLL